MASGEDTYARNQLAALERRVAALEAAGEPEPVGLDGAAGPTAPERLAMDHPHERVDDLHTCGCEKRGYDAALRALAKTRPQ
jgi:hypothetical protein